MIRLPRVKVNMNYLRTSQVMNKLISHMFYQPIRNMLERRYVY